MRIEINQYIVADSSICHGKLTFNGTRVMVWQVLELLEAGIPVKEILNYFLVPLTKEQIKAALQYAANLMRGGENVQFSVPLRA